MPAVSAYLPAVCVCAWGCDPCHGVLPAQLGHRAAQKVASQPLNFAFLAGLRVEILSELAGYATLCWCAAFVPLRPCLGSTDHPGSLWYAAEVPEEAAAVKQHPPPPGYWARYPAIFASLDVCVAVVYQRSVPG
mmetsp:Transcript_12323/g.28891  ORF Transcript_12323/g.28891 Transcript_12323/m.28891 type:complete len:134 (+) Transcript_12323:434-835(+)